MPTAASLEMRQIVPWLKKAHRALLKLNLTLLQQRNSRILLEPLLWIETLATLRSKHHPPSLKQLRATKAAIDAAIKTPVQTKFTPAFLCSLHQMLRAGDAKKEDIGHLRQKQNWIGPIGCSYEKAYYYPPPPDQVPALLHKWQIYVESKEQDLLLQMALAFAEFLIIHPFLDANGRLARLFLLIFTKKKKILTQPALLLSAYFERTRNVYVNKLYALSTKNAWEEWVVYFLKGITTQATKTNRFLKKLETLYQSLEQTAGRKAAEELFLRPFLPRKNKH